MKISPTIFLIISSGLEHILVLCFNIQIDTDDFKSHVLSNEMFIDKTLFIRYFIEMSKNYPFVKVIVRPEGWTKSCNLNMIEKFFEIEVDDKGDPLPKERTINHKLFLGGNITSSNKSIELKPLEISEFSNYTRDHLGKYPVILLKLKNATGNNYNEIKNNIKSCIRQAYQRHEYLINSSRITKREKLQNYFTGNISSNDLIGSLPFLCEKLHQHFNQKVHILIDDYDIPIISAYLSLGDKSRGEFDKVHELLWNIYDDAFKGNIYRATGLLVGVLVIDLNTYPDNFYSFMTSESSPELRDYFGFTDIEVDPLLGVIGMPMNEDQREMRTWYYGYNGPLRVYYNMRSMMLSASNNGTLKGYHGADDVRTALIERAILSDINNTLQLLIHDQNYGRLIMKDFYHRDDFTFNDTKPICWYPLDVDRILQQSGYLTSNYHLPPALVIPNKDMKNVFQMKTLQWVAGRFDIDTSEFHSLFSLLDRNHMHELKDRFLNFVFNAANFFLTVRKIAKQLYESSMGKLKYVLSSCPDNEVVEEIKTLAIRVQKVSEKVLEFSDKFKFDNIKYTPKLQKSFFTASIPL
ncbi:uncharacterized protein LOC135843925 [Planococcus citri]|uniref:uncharacterized protein LOC135843925 n=1 Tax=Planococcus citri TaxID=170843 RepID=UPI0031F8B9FF